MMQIVAVISSIKHNYRSLLNNELHKNITNLYPYHTLSSVPEKGVMGQRHGFFGTPDLLPHINALGKLLKKFYQSIITFAQEIQKILSLLQIRLFAARMLHIAARFLFSILAAILVQFSASNYPCTPIST